jgi:hypothetical protein
LTRFVTSEVIRLTLLFRSLVIRVRFSPQLSSCLRALKHITAAALTDIVQVKLFHIRSSLELFIDPAARALLLTPVIIIIDARVDKHAPAFAMFRDENSVSSLIPVMLHKS